MQPDALPPDQSRSLLLRVRIETPDERREWQRVFWLERNAGAGASVASHCAWTAVQVSRLPERERDEWNRVHGFQRRTGVGRESAIAFAWKALDEFRANSRQLSLFGDGGVR